MQPKHTEPLFIQAAAAAAAAGLLQGHDSEGTKNQLTSVTLAWRQNQTPVYFHCTGNGYCELQRLEPSAWCYVWMHSVHKDTYE